MNKKTIVKKLKTSKVSSSSNLVNVAYNDTNVPNDLRINPFLGQILKFPADKLFDFNVNALKTLGYKNVISFWHPENGYIYAEGTLPICLVAHMDRVYHEDIKTINAVSLLDTNGKIVDVRMFSKQGIGGDDRCGVYSILQMLKLGHRPSVLFFMGEEIGCCGARRFTEDFPKDFLSNVNCFIEIDRRGNHDCVRYSDDNDALTKVIETFDFKFAWGSCTDISKLMPHFGISGINLSSGYYNEHSGKTEFISIKDLNYLIKRLDKILSSDKFNEKFEYKSRPSVYSYPHYYRPIYDSVPKNKSFEQLSLLQDMPYIDNQIDNCEYCGEPVDKDSLVEVLPEGIFICKDCVQDFLSQGYQQCPCCGKLNLPVCEPDDPDFVHNYCEYCGACLDEEF